MYIYIYFVCVCILYRDLIKEKGRKNKWAAGWGRGCWYGGDVGARGGGGGGEGVSGGSRLIYLFFQRIKSEGYLGIKE